MTQPILVTGAGGQVGGVGNKIVESLLKNKRPVRAMLRTHDQRAEHLIKMGAEVVVGDLTNLTNLHHAIQGCQRIYFGMSVSAQYLEATVNVAAVAKHYDVEVLVNISQMTVSQMSITETTPSPQQKLHWLSEQVLNWSGLPVVHVRATVFLENFFFLDWASESISKADEIRLPFGMGRTSPVATADVARVISEILINPQSHIGKIYELTGPKSQNMFEIANEYSAALGRSIRYVDVSFDDWAANELASRGLPPYVVAHISTMARLHKENRYDRKTDDVQKITGKAATGISEWVLTNRDTFGKGRTI